MAKFIKDIHDFVNFLTGKGQTGYHSPEEIDEAVYFASRDLFDEKYKLYQINQLSTDDLKPFSSGPTTITIDVNGQFALPVDYFHLSSIGFGTSYTRIEQVEDAFLSNKLNDPLCGPDASHPIVIMYDQYMQFYPISGISSPKFNYLKTPVRPVYAYTIVNDRPVYDDGSSVDVEWNTGNQSELALKTLNYLGINLREGELVQYSFAKEARQ